MVVYMAMWPFIIKLVNFFQELMLMASESKEKLNLRMGQSIQAVFTKIYFMGRGH